MGLFLRVLLVFSLILLFKHIGAAHSRRLLHIGAAKHLLTANQVLGRDVDHRVVNGWLCHHLGSLNWLVLDNSLHSFLRNILDFSLVAILGHIFGDMFYLLVVYVGLLHGTVLGLHDGLVLHDGFGNWHIFNNFLRNVFNDLALVRNLLLNRYGLVVYVEIGRASCRERV